MRLSQSQQAIVHLLRRRGSMTVEEMSRELGISGVAVRQHLEGLAADGLLGSETEKRPIGRPRRLFHLTEAADELFPKDYCGLIQVILEHLETSGRGEEIEAVFDARRRRQEQEVAADLEGLPLAERVAATAALQDRAGYMAEWEQAPDDSFLLREYNCTICRVARRYPQACAAELELIRSLTGGDVTREEHLMAGDSACVYRIRPRQPS